MKNRYSEEYKKHLEEIYQNFLHDEKILKMKEVQMHRGSNCYLHSFRVARLAVHKALKRKNVDVEAVLLAAILHDYYLYDWRKDKSKKKHHGSRHPYIASEHAIRDFNVNELTQKIIKSHMWPLNFKEFPSTREAKILSISDKSIATREALCSRKHKKKKWNQYEKMISHLYKE